MKKWLVHVLLVLMLCCLVVVLPVAADEWNWATDGWNGWSHSASWSGQLAGYNYEYGPFILNGYGEHGASVNLMGGITQASVERTFIDPTGQGWNTLTFKGKLSGSDVPAGRWMKINVNGLEVFSGTADSFPPGNGQDFEIQCSFPQSSSVKINISHGQNPAWGPLFLMSYDSLKLTGMTLSPSSITVSSPNGGESWQRGTYHTITWDYTGNPGSTVKIVLLKAGTQSTIQGMWPIGSSGKGSYSWPISLFGATGSDYKVSVQSLSQSTIKDTSDGYFTLSSTGTATPTIMVTAPNGGETWQRGTYRTITWSYTGDPGSAVKIVLLKAGTEVGTINTSTSIGSDGIGSCTWNINPAGTIGSDYKVSVQSISQSTIKDTSDGYFTLSSAGTATPTIMVTEPNGGETWIRGTSNTVTWDYTGSPGSTVKIVLLKAGAEVGTIASSTSIGTSGQGSYTWPINPVGSTGSDYKVSVQSISQPAIKDTSNNYFAIAPVGTIASSIIVTSPNGGESWQRGTYRTITWDYTGNPGSTVKIVLLKAGTQSTIQGMWSIGSSGKGSYSWPISLFGTTGSDYKVSVQSISQPSIKDTSNNYFTLTSEGTPIPTIPNTITVTSPNGGETWQRGTYHTVTWHYTGSPGSYVKLVLLKAGVEVGTIQGMWSTGSFGEGSYFWPISVYGTTGSDYTVSVQSISQPAIKDTSDNYFTLTPTGTSPPSITVTAPNGGESWKRGTTQMVKWSFIGSPGSYVKVELLQGGTPVGTATYSTSIGGGGIGSYPWAISSGRAPGTNYRIRVTSVSQPTISDTSNGDFTITL